MPAKRRKLGIQSTRLTPSGQTGGKLGRNDPYDKPTEAGRETGAVIAGPGVLVYRGATHKVLTWWLR